MESNNWYNSFYSILINTIGNKNVAHTDIHWFGNSSSMREFTFSYHNTKWIFRTVSSFRGKTDTLENKNAKIHYKLILKDFYPKAFYINNKEYLINKGNVNFITSKFPYLKTYFKKNPHILNKLKTINPDTKKVKPSFIELLPLYLYGSSH